MRHRGRRRRWRWTPLAYGLAREAVKFVLEFTVVSVGIVAFVWAAWLIAG